MRRTRHAVDISSGCDRGRIPR